MTSGVPQLPEARWTASIHAGLQQLIASACHTSPPPVAVFDWDHTVIDRDMWTMVVGHIDAVDGQDRLGTYHRLGEEHGTAVSYPYATTCLAGQRDADLRAHAATVIAQEAATGRMGIRPEMAQLITALRDAGWDVWVVSASPTQFVETFAAKIGVPAHRVIAMRLSVQADGTLSNTLEQPAPCLEGKVHAIDAFIGQRPTLVAGDSGGDLAMLHYARHRLVIAGPEGGGAVEAARERGWWLQEGWTSDPESSS